MERQNQKESRVLLERLLKEKAAKNLRWLPLSQGQHALWIQHQMVPESAAYHIGFTARISKNLNPLWLRRALQSLVVRHPQLRSCYPMREGETVQEQYQYQELSFTEMDASGLDDEELRQQVIASYRAPFDLARGPVFRAALFTRSKWEYLLLLVLHHISGDGWSLWVMLDELRQHYLAEARGESAALPALTFTNAEFVVWEQKILNGAEGERLKKYWVSKLEDAETVLQLPTDYPRATFPSHDGASHPFRIDAEMTRQIREASCSHGVTLFNYLISLFFVLLHRLSQQQVVLIGIPISRRDKPELAPLVGYFLNMIPLKGDFTGSPSFVQLLQQVRRSVLEAIEHADYPLRQIIDAVKPERTPGLAPLFQVSFVLQQPHQSKEVGALMTGHGSWDWGEICLNPYPLPQQEGQFDFMLELIEADTELIGLFKYRTELFSPETIVRFERSLMTLLRHSLVKPDEPVSRWSMLTEAERRKILVQWNETEREYRFDPCVPQLVESQALRAPEALAVAFGSIELSYAELNQRANQVAHYLRARGVDPEVVVAVCLERSPVLVVALLGILKAGGAYLPLDPKYPRERLRFMLADSGATLLLTQNSLLTQLQDQVVETVPIDVDEGIERQSRDNPELVNRPEHLAYVIYTSGSTGTPKGVEIPHRGLSNLVHWHLEAFHVTNRDRATVLAGHAFDASVWETWPYLVAGASLALVPPELVFTPERLWPWLKESGITLSFLPTPLAEKLLVLPIPEGLPLRIMLTGGDVLHCYPEPGLPFSVVNNYGPTECSVVATSGVVLREEAILPTLGRPIANTKIYILDRHLEPVPVGVTGEIHIGGAGVARGYRNREELTRERFVKNPFDEGWCGRLYKTGDLGRYRPDGTLQFVTRLDQQVKLNGYRIELGEIEAALRECHEILEAAVVPHDVRPGYRRLVAYLVPRAEIPASKLLRDQLKERLPMFMIPSSFQFLRKLPLTSNGKLDRAALPAISRVDAAYRAPEGPTEELLCQVWCEVLGVERVGVDDNFFEVGGHSLLATQIISRLRDALQQELPLRALFETTTVAELAKLIEKQRPMTASQPILRQLPRDRNRVTISALGEVEIPEDLAQSIEQSKASRRQA